MNICIETLKKEELEQYKFLIDSCFDNSNSLETYKQSYSEGGQYVILVAKDNGKMVGSITLYQIDLFTFSFQPALEIFNVAVLKEYRRQNIAKTLFNYVIEYATKNSFKSIFLTCLDTAYSAHKLYESVGFKKMSSVKYSLDLSLLK